MTHLKVNLSSKFLALEEFLCLPEMDGREFHRTFTGTEWLHRYQIAKMSWQKYGSQGPAVGSDVITLLPGHGGGAGMIKSFGGDFESATHTICKTESCWFQLGPNTSLVYKETWWREIVPYEFITQENRHLFDQIFPRIFLNMACQDSRDAA